MTSRTHTALFRFVSVVIRRWPALIASAVMVSAADAQRGTPVATDHRAWPLLGVYDAGTGSPLQGAVVRDTLGTEAVTSADGAVALNFIAPIGPYYLIEIRKTGYRTLRLRIRADSLTDRTEMLEPLPLGSAAELAAVTVTEKYNLNLDAGLREGFAMRCQSKLVACYDEEALRAHPAAALYDFIKQTRGVVSDCGATTNRAGRGGIRRPTGSGGKPLDCVKMRRSTPDADPLCVPTFYLDGFPRGATVTTLDELEQSLDPLTVTGIEVYLSGRPTPMKYTNGTANVGCGSVVIWTR